MRQMEAGTNTEQSQTGMRCIDNSGVPDRRNRLRTSTWLLLASLLWFVQPSCFADEPPAASQPEIAAILAMPLLSDVPATTTYEDLLAELAVRSKRSIRLNTESFAALGFRISDHLPASFAGKTLGESLAVLSSGQPRGLSGTLSVTDDRGVVVIALAGKSPHPLPPELPNLFAPLKLQGIVRGFDGDLIPHARILIRRGGEFTFATADETGHFSIPVSDSGEHGMSVLTSDPSGDRRGIWQWGRFSDPLESPDRVRELDLVVMPRVQIQVKVFDSKQQPVAHARVAVVSWNQWITSAYTDAHGEVSIPVGVKTAAR